jgi:hypothetical protein
VFRVPFVCLLWPMARPRSFDDLKRVKISIEEKLHEDAKDYAEALSLADGFSGLVSRLLIHHMKKKGQHVATFPRKYKGGVTR